MDDADTDADAEAEAFVSSQVYPREVHISRRYADDELVRLGAYGRARRHGKPSREGAEENMRIAWQMRINGATELDIAQHLGCSQPAVSKMLEKARHLHSQELGNQVQELRAEQHARLERMFEEALRGFYHPPTVEETKVTRNKISVTPDGRVLLNPDLVETTRTVKPRDPRYLQVAQHALKQQSQLYGLDAPKKLDVTTDERKVITYQVVPPGHPDAPTLTHTTHQRLMPPSTPTLGPDQVDVVDPNVIEAEFRSNPLSGLRRPLDLEGPEPTVHIELEDT